MNKFFAKLLTCHIKDKQERRAKRKELLFGISNPDRIKLIMTLVVKNEEEIIETNIRFHKAMGVDGFIVLNHESTDETLEILERLKKEGIVLEIINKTGEKHCHSLWVNEMVKLATQKYNANWIINADADEFYYSKDLDLKKSICKYPSLNVIKVDSLFSFPSEKKNFLENPYFDLHPLQEFELDDMPFRNEFTEYFSRTSLTDCPKMIHQTKGFIRIFDGNHDILMKDKKMANSNDIVLYHYHIVNYKRYEQKAKRWAQGAKYLEGEDNYIKKLVHLYKTDHLKEYYDAFYGEKMKKLLEERGVIGKDFSIINFLKYKGIYPSKKEV